METITISKDEYDKLKLKANMANVDLELLDQLTESFRDIKEGRVRRVK